MASTAFPHGKRWVYEPSVKVPLLVRGPGFPAGKTRRQPVVNVDTAKTIVDLAGATPELTLDGASLLPVANSARAAKNRAVLLETVKGHSAVRTSEWLYVEHNNGERELYDMRAGTPNYDPNQNVSRHGDPAYDSFKAVLIGKLNMLRSCQGAACLVQ